MAAESSRKASINLSKTTVVFGLVLLALGYFIGNTLPIASDDFRLQPENPIMTSTVGQGEQFSEKKIQGTINFYVPSFVKFKGSDTATVNLVEFGDYQCPFCKIL